MSLPPILHVEDDENDILLLAISFRRAMIDNPIQVVRSGQSAIDYLSGTGEFAGLAESPAPALVVLDLKLAGLKSGVDVLEWVRHQPKLSKIPIVAFTSWASDEEIQRVYRLGAGSLVVKPTDLKRHEEFAALQKAMWLEPGRKTGVKGA